MQYSNNNDYNNNNDNFMNSYKEIYLLLHIKLLIKWPFTSISSIACFWFPFSIIATWPVSKSYTFMFFDPLLQHNTSADEKHWWFCKNYFYVYQMLVYYFLHLFFFRSRFDIVLATCRATCSQTSLKQLICALMRKVLWVRINCKMAGISLQ